MSQIASGGPISGSSSPRTASPKADAPPEQLRESVPPPCVPELPVTLTRGGRQRGSCSTSAYGLDLIAGDPYPWRATTWQLRETVPPLVCSRSFLRHDRRQSAAWVPAASKKPRGGLVSRTWGKAIHGFFSLLTRGRGNRFPLAGKADFGLSGNPRPRCPGPAPCAWPGIMRSLRMPWPAHPGLPHKTSGGGSCDGGRLPTRGSRIHPGLPPYPLRNFVYNR